MTAAIVSDAFSGVNVRATPNGKIVGAVHKGYNVTILGVEKKTTTVTWTKIRYLFDGKVKEGWVAKEVHGEPTLIPQAEYVPPRVTSVDPDEGKPLQAPVHEIPLFRSSIWDITLSVGSAIIIIGGFYLLVGLFFDWF